MKTIEFSLIFLISIIFLISMLSILSFYTKSILDKNKEIESIYTFQKIYEKISECKILSNYFDEGEIQTYVVTDTPINVIANDSFVIINKRNFSIYPFYVNYTYLSGRKIKIVCTWRDTHKYIKFLS